MLRVCKDLLVGIALLSPVVKRTVTIDVMRWIVSVEVALCLKIDEAFVKIRKGGDWKLQLLACMRESLQLVHTSLVSNRTNQ